MATHRAIVLSSWSEAAKLQEIPKPEVGPGRVVVRILASKVLNYIRKVMSNPEFFPKPLPITLGNNAIGRVESVGPDAVSLKPGQLVYCDIFIKGRDNPDVTTLQGLLVGNGPQLMSSDLRNSSYAEYVSYPLENVYPLDEERLLGHLGYTIEDLLWMTSSMVPYGGLANIKVTAGETVIVAPATGVYGGGAVHLALSMGANVIAAGRNTEVLEAMKKTYGGAGTLETVVLTGEVEKDTEAFMAATRGKGADAFVDFSPPEAANSSYFTAALQALKRFGRVSISGGSPRDLPVPYWLLVFKNISLHGNFMYTREDIVKLIQMTENGIFKVDEKSSGQKLIGKYSLDQWDEAVEAASAAKTWGSTVVLNP